MVERINILLFLLIYSVIIYGRNVEQPRYDTAYSCEGRVLEINCKPGEIIQLIRANYGRFSITICNDHGHTNWSVSCMSPKSLRVLHAECSAKHNCSVAASSAIFGDPCPGTLKYLEAHYLCMPESLTTTTTRPNPPWLVTSQPSVWSTVKAPTLLPPVALTSTPKNVSDATSPSVEEEIRIVTKPDTVTTTAPPEKFESCDDLNKCLFHKSNARTEKPDCESGVSPDCYSKWLTTIRARVLTNESIPDIARDLASATEAKLLSNSDLVETARLISLMARRMSVLVDSRSSDSERRGVNNLVRSVVRISSGLIDKSLSDQWANLSISDQSKIATNILIGVENNSFLLAETIDVEKTVRNYDDNVFVEVKAVRSQHFADEVFTCGSSRWNGTDNWLKLDRRSLDSHKRGRLLKIVYSAFNNFDSIISRGNETRFVNTQVVSASFGKRVRLSHPVTICLKHVLTENVIEPTCVFWDASIDGWSQVGCDLIRSNKTHSICSCDHLTHFAVLMEVRPVYLSPTHEMHLEIITYIGCAVSITCLFFTIFTFQIFKNLQSDRTTIHTNLCLCLLIAEVIFVAGIDQVFDRILCSIIAGLLHYFFLCAFAWMLLEGIQLYVMLIEVFEAEKSRVKYYYIFGYGAPLIIVCVSAFLDPSGYGTDNYCWLRNDNYFIYSFIGPVAAVIMANLVFLSMTVLMMCRHAANLQALKTNERSKLTSIRLWLKGAFVLVFVLGLTWTFGFLHLNEDTLVVAYVFTVLNSLQGLFIFVFYCAQNEKVRKEYGKFAVRHPLLSSCFVSKDSGGSSTESKDRQTSSMFTHGSSTSHSHHAETPSTAL